MYIIKTYNSKKVIFIKLNILLTLILYCTIVRLTINNGYINIQMKLTDHGTFNKYMVPQNILRRHEGKYVFSEEKVQIATGLIQSNAFKISNSRD